MADMDMATDTVMDMVMGMVELTIATMQSRKLSVSLGGNHY